MPFTEEQCKFCAFVCEHVLECENNLHKKIVMHGADTVIEEQWELNEPAFTSWLLCGFLLLKDIC